MKSRYILYILIVLLTLSVPTRTEAVASVIDLEQTKTKSTTTTTKKKKTKARTTKKRSTKRRTTRRASTAKAKSEAEATTPVVRTLSGIVPPPQAEQWREVINQVPPQIRFVRGDSTLKGRDIEQLYYAKRVMCQHYTTKIQEEIQREVHAVQYAKAYKACRRALWHDPIDLSLIKRAGELANHLHLDKDKEIYIWQLTEILHLISQTGTGASIEKAYEVRREEDAAIFEKLWLDTPLEAIVGSRRSSYDNRPLLELQIKQADSEVSLVRYYRLQQ